MNYTDPTTLVRIYELLSDLESLDNINEHLTRSWIHHYQTFASAKQFLLNESVTMDSETDFVRKTYEFYKMRQSPFSLDIAYNANISRIVASRFLVQGYNIRSTLDEEKMVLDIRNVVKKHSDSQVQVQPSHSIKI